MSRLNQLHANDYPSQTKIQAEFAQLIGYLISAERGNQTIPELFDKIFDSGGSIKSDLLEFAWANNELQYRVGGGAWHSTGATLATLQGAPGVSGAGTGDMVRATYDPDDDGKIDLAELDLPDNGIQQAKIEDLGTDLALKLRCEVGSVAPISPTYPPAGALTFWLDTTQAQNPTLKYWDGVAAWRNLFDVNAVAGIEVVSAEAVAAETVASRELVSIMPVNFYEDTGFASGGSILASGGTGTNAFDNNTGTSCDTGSATGSVGYNRTSGQAQAQVGMIAVLFETGTRNHALVVETSPDNVSWTTAATFTVTNYDGSQWSFFEIPPTTCQAIRLRGTAGSSNLVIREMKILQRMAARGQALKASNARRGGAMGMALANGTTGNAFKIQVAPGLVTGFSGLTANQPVYSGTTAGGITSTATARSVCIGYAKSSTEVNFIPPVQGVPVGGMVKFAGPDANIPPNFAKANGLAVSRTQYPDLYINIGVTNGSGDGVTSFNLPSDTGFIIRLF